MKVHGADILPDASVALQLTVVVPTGKLLPEAGVQATVKPVGQLSVAVGGVKVTVAAQVPFGAMTFVIFDGQAPSTGNWASLIVTVKVHGADILPEASVALQLTVVVPTAKLLPEAGVQATVAFGQLSVTVGLVKVTANAH